MEGLGGNCVCRCLYGSTAPHIKGERLRILTQLVALAEFSQWNGLVVVDDDRGIQKICCDLPLQAGKFLIQSTPGGYKAFIADQPTDFILMGVQKYFAADFIENLGN